MESENNQQPRIIIVGYSISSIQPFIEQIRQTLEKQDLLVVINDKDEIEHSFGQARDCHKDLITEINIMAQQLEKTNNPLPEPKPKWSGKRGFNSARNRIIT